MTFKELKEKLNMDKRVGKVKCYGHENGRMEVVISLTNIINNL